MPLTLNKKAQGREVRPGVGAAGGFDETLIGFKGCVTVAPSQGALCVPGLVRRSNPRESGEASLGAYCCMAPEPTNGPPPFGPRFLAPPGRNWASTGDR